MQRARCKHSIAKIIGLDLYGSLGPRWLVCKSQGRVISAKNPKTSLRLNGSVFSLIQVHISFGTIPGFNGGILAKITTTRSALTLNAAGY